MKTDEQILEELKQATSGLLMMSESDYPFEIIRWEAAFDPTAEALRHRAGEAIDAPVNEQSIDEFFRAAIIERADQTSEARRTALQFQALVQLLQENLRDVKTYRIGERNIRVYIIGKTGSGEWMGLSTQIVET